MPIDLGIVFPTEAEALRRQAEAERDLTPTQRLHALIDLLSAAELLSNAGTARRGQLQYHDEMEKEWQRRMKEFFKQHGVCE